MAKCEHTHTHIRHASGNSSTTRWILFALKFERDDTNVMTSACVLCVCVCERERAPDECWTRISFSSTTARMRRRVLPFVCFRVFNLPANILGCLTSRWVLISHHSVSVVDGVCGRTDEPKRFFLIAYLFRGTIYVDFIIKSQLSKQINLIFCNMPKIANWIFMQKALARNFCEKSSMKNLRRKSRYRDMYAKCVVCT